MYLCYIRCHLRLQVQVRHLQTSAQTYLQPHYEWGFRQCLPFSWTTLRGKHCWHPIAVMGVVCRYVWAYWLWPATSISRSDIPPLSTCCISKISSLHRLFGKRPQNTNPLQISFCFWANSFWWKLYLLGKGLLCSKKGTIQNKAKNLWLISSSSP